MYQMTLTTSDGNNSYFQPRGLIVFKCSAVQTCFYNVSYLAQEVRQAGRQGREAGKEGRQRNRVLCTSRGRRYISYNSRAGRVLGVWLAGVCCCCSSFSLPRLELAFAG